WQRLVQRHALFRTVFQWAGPNGPCQQVHRHVTIPWTRVDWRGLSARERRRRWAALLQTERLRGFDVALAPPSRLVLVREQQCVYRFFWTNHHLIMDGRQLVLMWNEIFACYEALCRGEPWTPEPAPSYRSHIAWLGRQDWSRAEAYWRMALKGFHAPTPLPVMLRPPRALGPVDMRGGQEIKFSDRLPQDL